MTGNDTRRKWPSRTSLTVFFLIAVPLIYVLSYAPVLRLWRLRFPSKPLQFRNDGHDLLDGRDLPPYKAVDWLIDNTPAREPLFKWADLWGVRDEFVATWVAREFRPEHEM